MCRRERLGLRERGAFASARRARPSARACPGLAARHPAGTRTPPRRAPPRPAPPGAPTARAVASPLAQLRRCVLKGREESGGFGKGRRDRAGVGRGRGRAGPCRVTRASAEVSRRRGPAQPGLARSEDGGGRGFGGARSAPGAAGGGWGGGGRSPVVPGPPPFPRAPRAAARPLPRPRRMAP